MVDAESLVPALWPAGGLAAGLLLTSPGHLRPGLTAGVFALMLAAFLLQGYDWTVAIGFSASSAAAAWVVRAQLVRGLDGRRAALLDQGDVSRLIGAITVGSAVAGIGSGLTVQLTGDGVPWLGALSAFGASAASLMVLLPLFLETLTFEPLARRRERVIQGALTLGTTFAVFMSTNAPLVIFAVMPMFAWHAFRGTLREATVLLTLTGVIGTSLTMLEIGPVFALGTRYGLEPELANGVLQLFLVDCGLILLPLSVMVTQQRMSASRADAERETLRRLVQSATGTAIIATGNTGRIALFNPGAEAMLGYVAEEVIGQLPGRVPPRRRAASTGLAAAGAAELLRHLPRGSVAAGDRNQLWRFVRKDGEERTMRMTLTAVPGELGELTGYLATAEDVTEREDAQRALLLTLEHQRTAVERLRELERVKGDFVSTVSHELRTPITSIIGYTELLGEGAVGELTLSQQEIIDRVDRNGRRLLLLVEDLLTLSQIEASALKIEPVITDVRTVVTNAHEAITTTLADRALDVSVLVPTQPVVHHGDPVQLERMLVNLLTNAVKFTPDGGRVELQLRALSENTEIVISDTGMGIPEHEQSKLFTRFFRSSTATERAIQGTGLGLTIVKAIVALHGGRIDVESAPQHGTTVTVSLPRQQDAVAVGCATG